ncbi:hypothetical protein ACIBCR_14970 [Micromonospora echinospora]|uniref:hypothetical protein n=1 Tax=Micromonospora echinospora TaxID=1877 RepID=UPI003787F771
MTTTIKARTARIPHLCDGCHWTPSLRGVPTIAPGHRYLRHTAFPGDEVNETVRPYTNTECIACLAERDPAAPLLLGDACSTFCCGVVPCARPFGHDGGHECRRCIAEPAPAANAAQPNADPKTKEG